MDDVGLHEEDEQLQDPDEQQQQEDEDIDDEKQEEVEDDGGADQSEGVVDHIDNMELDFYEESRLFAEQNEVDVNDEYLQSFEHTCEQIHENDSALDEFDCDSIALDDSRAILLGSALIGNTELSELGLSFMHQAHLTQQGESFTSRGARAILGGIFGSNIKYLSISGSEELPLEMSQLCARSIEELYMHFPIGDDFAGQLGESLMACKSLRRFTLQVYPRMTPCGAQALSSFLCSSLISTLEFTAAPESASSSMPTKETMQTLYVEGVQHSQSIENICLYRIVGDMGALATALPKLIRNLTIATVDLSLSEVELLTRGLSNAHQLSELSLAGCKLSDEHMIVLSRVVGDHPSIRKVELYKNKIGDAGVIFFVEHWKAESSIDELVLYENDIGSKGAERLVQALSNRSTFRMLDLNHNRSIGYNGLKLIGDALPTANIQRLDLVTVINWIEYGDVNCDEAVAQEAQCTAAGKALVEGVRGNQQLMQIRIYNSHFPDVCREEIDLYIEANALGRGAVLENQHALPIGVWCYFLAKRGMSSSLMFVFLRELPGVVMYGTFGRKRKSAGCDPLRM